MTLITKVTVVMIKMITKYNNNAYNNRKNNNNSKNGNNTVTQLAIKTETTSNWKH